MFKNEMRSYVRIGGRGLKNLTYPYMWVGGVKNCQNHPYVINEWPQRRLKKANTQSIYRGTTPHQTKSNVETVGVLISKQ